MSPKYNSRAPSVRMEKHNFLSVLLRGKNLAPVNLSQFFSFMTASDLYLMGNAHMAEDGVTVRTKTCLDPSIAVGFIGVIVSNEIRKESLSHFQACRDFGTGLLVILLTAHAWHSIECLSLKQFLIDCISVKLRSFMRPF